MDWGRAAGARSRVHQILPAASLCALIVVPAFALTALLEWRDYVRHLDAADVAATRLAHLLEEQTSRTFQAVDLTLIGVVDALRLAPALPDHDPPFEDALRRRRDALPQVRALWVVGPDGFARQNSEHPSTPRLHLADRDYFTVHARDPQAGLYIGPPLVSRSRGISFVSMSRRIETPDGRFGGVAVAAVEPRYFESFYDALDLGDRDNITLLHRDGTLIARSPHDPAFVGRSFASDELFRDRLPGRHAETFAAVSPVDGVTRVVSYRVVPGTPLVVLVGLDKAFLVAEAREHALRAFTATGLVSLLVCALVVLLARRARERAEARERLIEAQKLEALGRIAGGIAHDFGNILGTIRNGVEVALRGAADEQVRRSLEVAVRAVARGTGLASQLLAFARRQELRVEAANASRLVTEIEQLLRQAASPAAQLSLELAPDVWPCRVDDSQFGVALLNLVVNARDAVAARPGRIRIATANVHLDEGRATSGLAAGDYVRVTVGDEGTGMTPEVARRAAEPFFTTKREGTGLGLSQVYGFVKQVGGGLAIESAPGRGTAVHLYFPRAPGPEGARLAETARMAAG
jgi:signal transduction histidine kinase